MKKPISLFSIALVIAGILIMWTHSLTLSSEQIPEAKKNNAHTLKVWRKKSKLIQRDVTVMKQPCLTQSVQGIKEFLGNASAPLDQKLVSKFQPADLDTEMRHPALADAGDGYLVKFWENIFYGSPIESTLQMGGSTDDGASWHTPTVWSQQYPPGYPGYFPQGGGLPRYPSLGHWGSDGTYDHIFYGTCVSPSTYHNGGEPQLFVIKDILDDTTWAKWRWAFDTSDGTRNMKCAEIAVDSSQHYENPLAEERPWGIQGLILSQPSNPEYPHTDAPYLFWEYKEEGWAVFNYYYTLERCQSIDAAIDPVTATAYTVFDRPDTVDHKYKLYIRQYPWDMMTKESYVLPDLAWEPQLVIWQFYFEDSLADIEHPVMAVHGGNLVIVFEVVHQPNPDSIDLVVWHCYDGEPVHFVYSYWIAGSEYDERYPEIAWVDSNYFICTFVKQNKLFACKSCGGGSWSDPV
jgi:hypothetical protein